MPQVKSMRRRKKVRPGTTTKHAKFKRPIKDCSSFKVIVRFHLANRKHSRILISLRSGKRQIKATESISIP